MIESMDALCSLLPEGVHWGDPLTPELLRELLGAGMTGDEACRFGVWWSHKRKTFTTARQAAWAAWTEASSKPPKGKRYEAGDWSMRNYEAWTEDQGAQPAAQQERERFEAWFANQSWHGGSAIENAWRVWQAAGAQPAAQPQEDRERVREFDTIASDPASREVMSSSKSELLPPAGAPLPQEHSRSDRR